MPSCTEESERIFEIGLRLAVGGEHKHRDVVDLACQKLKQQQRGPVGEELSPTRLRFIQRNSKLCELPLPADKHAAGCESFTLHFRGRDSDAASERKQSSAQ
jgi:hypothetical protein